MRPLSVLYLSRDGMLEPLGLSQVVAYLEKLAGSQEYRFFLISFEKASDLAQRERREELSNRLRRAGIQWYPLRFHGSPAIFAPILDMVRASALAGWLTLRHRVAIVHARSYIAALPAYLLSWFGPRFVFDMRGFWADERADTGQWKRGSLVYSLMKKLEALYLRRARAVVSLTRAAVVEMRAFPYLRDRAPEFFVIPTCTDLERFRPADAAEKPFTLGYVGSTGHWYDFGPVARAFSRLRELEPTARLLVVTRDPHERVRQALADAPTDSYLLVSATPEETAARMREMHAGLFFLKPMYSKLASVPTRLGEYLASGLPCLANDVAGDIRSTLAERGVGVLVTAVPSDQELAAAVASLRALAKEPAVKNRCRKLAEEEFSLDSGVAAYRTVYERARR
jgi:glycosyltransferase involved in cell wall biosynthesis